MSDRIERRIELPTSLELAWQAMTDPDWLALWLADDIHLDPRPGGEAHFQIGTETRTGLGRGGEPARRPHGAGRLAFWWAVDEEPASRVELTVMAIGSDCTLLCVVESRPLDVPGSSGHPAAGPRWPSAYGPALVAA